MRNKRETDISNYTERIPTPPRNARKTDSGGKKLLKGIGKFFLTAFAVCFIAGVITVVSLGIYIYHLASEPTGIDLKAKSMNQTSRIFVFDANANKFTERQKLYDVENRTWVDYAEIPENMKKAQITIEDKRFYDHKGVDWTRTVSAIGAMLTGSDSYGGSTITQQLIKNLTDDNEVSITRKLREICKALKLEQEYSKEQILEAYLNVVNYGNNCQGVEAAAQLYFGKSIKDCSLAQCAAIAGITQNPSHWNPLLYPENNHKRRENILYEMYDQGKISEQELKSALAESNNMTFVGFSSNHSDDDEEEEDNVQNWYYNQMIYDLRADLAKLYNISEGAASEKIYTEGLSIYSAMDEHMQDFIEAKALELGNDAEEPDIQIGSVLMDFDGRVIATVGSSQRKTGPLDWDRATHSTLQPGSSIKPVLVYPIAIEKQQLYFSSTVLDEPVDDYKLDEKTGEKIAGPKNAYGSYFGEMLLPDAIEYSSNATAVQVMKMIGGPKVAYEQATTKMGFKKLDEEDSYQIGSLSIGGMVGGVSVREMAAAFTYMGNGGLYYEPYTYYYVTDSEGNVIIDNRENVRVPKQAYSADTATIMNRLLHYNIENSQHTRAMYAQIPGWDIVGKTGTTDEDKDCWFCGMSPYAVMATWTGFDIPKTINDTTRSATFFNTVMSEYLKDKEVKEYTLSPNVIQARYNPYSGMIISTEYVYGQYVGYYVKDNMPAYGDSYYTPRHYDSDYNGYNYNYNYGDDSSADPGYDPGVDPGYDPGYDPGVDPGYDPGYDPGGGADPGGVDDGGVDDGGSGETPVGE